MMIQITTVKYSYHYKYFKKYIADNGNYICAVDGDIVSKEEGNEIFKNLKSEYPNCVVTREIIYKNDMEIFEYLENGIDKYVEYIDNYYQYRQAKDRNEQLWKLISNFRTICAEVK